MFILVVSIKILLILSSRALLKVTEDFHRLSFRLINPSKSDIGISKTLLDKINKILIATQYHINQWKSTKTVSDWFKNLADKKQCSFIQLDVENFYPLISLNLFNEAIQYACTITKITLVYIAMIGLY